MSSFAERLKKLRAARGITQEKLAKDLDIPEPTIRRLETSEGIPRKERLIQLSYYFKVPIDYLINGIIVDDEISNSKKKMIEDILVMNEDEYKLYEDLHNRIKK